MAQHKAPTEVSIASTHDETEFHQFVDRYWKPALGLVLAISAVVVGRQWMGQKKASAELAGWTRLGEDVQMASFGGFGELPSAPVLAELADELRDSIAGPWAKTLEIGERVSESDFDGANRAYQELAQTWPEHSIVTEAVFPQAEGPPRRLDQQIQARQAALQAWEAEQEQLFEFPPLPEGSPRVRLKTTAGEIVIGLYAERAPRHTENFLKLTREGFYDGVRFHRVLTEPRLIQGGDPNTVEGETSTWGLGGPGYTVEAEDTGIWHFPGALSAAKKPGDKVSSGSQFFLMLEASPGYDGEYTAYGRVVEGLDIVETIASGALEGDRPVEPVVIEAAEVIE